MADEASGLPEFSEEAAQHQEQQDFDEFLDFGGGDNGELMDNAPLLPMSSGEPVAEEDGLGTEKSRRFRAFLDTQFAATPDNKLLFNELTSQKSRLVVAGCFFELLYFKSHGLIDLNQAVPYGDIVITQ